MLVYIREAHAVDSAWPMATPDGTVIEEPLRFEERVANARHCKSALGLEAFHALVDSMEGEAERAYEAWPDRLFLIDTEGRVAFRSPPGPFGFEPDALAAAIQKEMARMRAAPVPADPR